MLAESVFIFIKAHFHSPKLEVTPIDETVSSQGLANKWSFVHSHDFLATWISSK